MILIGRWYVVLQITGSENANYADLIAALSDVEHKSKLW